MKKYLSIIAMLILSFCLVACTEGNVPVQENQSQDVINTSQDYTYEDTAILVYMDTGEKVITFQNVETGLRYTLNYDGTTYFNNKYGAAMSAQQVKCGTVAEITFDKDDKKLLSLQMSPDYFVYTDITFEEFIKQDTRFNFLKEEYKLDDFLVITDGNHDMERMELSKGDLISVCGRDHTIYSILLQSGHGYLRLENDEYFIGGWIEVGNKTIRMITEDMLLTVPEGSYQVLVSNEGVSGIKEVTIGRNQEVTLDLGDIDVEKKYGNVLFVLSPSDAKLYIDGQRADTGGPVSLEYGIHQLICMADGYDTLSSYIKVGDESASVTLTLSKTEEETDEDSSEENSESSSQSSSEKPSENSSQSSSEKTSENSSQSSSEKPSENSSEASSENASQNGTGNSAGSSNTGTASTGAKVYIDGPEGTEIYVDGSYVGIAPISFAKPEGSVVITLRRTGYQTRNYTIQMSQDNADVHYSFSDLIEIGQ